MALILDLRSHPCNWCGHKEGTSLCADCFRYTCKDCLLGYTEDGCVHRKKRILQFQTWVPPEEAQKAYDALKIEKKE